MCCFFFLLFTRVISLFSVSPMWAKRIAKQSVYSQNHCFFLRFCNLSLPIRRLCTRQDYLYPDIRGFAFCTYAGHKQTYMTVILEIVLASRHV